MRIAAEFDFNGGKDVVESRFVSELTELRAILAAVDAQLCRSKSNREHAALSGRPFDAKSIERSLRREMLECGWAVRRTEYAAASADYLDGYQDLLGNSSCRELGLSKGRLGMDLSFSSAPAMVYNVCAKMTIFRNLGHIDAGVEVVPVREFAAEMSTGVSYFQQFAWDLRKRGVGDIDVPVLILGVAP